MILRGKKWKKYFKLSIYNNILFIFWKAIENSCPIQTFISALRFIARACIPTLRGFARGTGVAEFDFFLISVDPGGMGSAFHWAGMDGNQKGSIGKS